MKKFFTYLILILSVFNLYIFNTYAATKKVEYKQPLTFDNITDLRDFIEMHHNLINVVKEKSKPQLKWPVMCKYLNNTWLRLSDIFSNWRILYISKEEFDEELDAEIILWFTNNSDFVCWDLGKKINGLGLFWTYTNQLKKWTKNFSFWNMVKIVDTYVNIGDDLFDQLIKLTVYNIFQQDISLKNPVYASYFNQIKDINWDNTQKIASDTNYKKFDPFTAPLYMCYLDSKTKNDMKICLKTFYNNIKNNTIISSTNKSKLKEIDNIFTQKKETD